MTKEQNPWRVVEEPIEIEKDAGVADSEVTHPAFAVIGVSRVSGEATLFQSEFKHQHYLSVRIGLAKLCRSLSRDWVFGHAKTYIEVNLSEAQWAAFVSSPNVGSGVPCTLRYNNGQIIPGLPDPKPPEAKFKAEVAKAAEEAVTQLDELAEKIAAMGLSAKKQKDLLDSVSRAKNKMKSSIPWVAKQFSEHMETTVEKAKTEVNAYATQTLQRMGLEALGITSPITVEAIEAKGEAE